MYDCVGRSACHRIAPLLLLSASTAEPDTTYTLPSIASTTTGHVVHCGSDVVVHSGCPVAAFRPVT